MWQQCNAKKNMPIRVGSFSSWSHQPSEWGKKCDLSDFDHGMIVGARQGGLSISEKLLISWDFHTEQPLEFAVSREWCEKQKTSSGQQFRGQKCVVNEERSRRDRKVTATQITTHCNSGMQKSVSEHTTCQSSKWIGYSSRSSLSKKSNKYLIKCSVSVYKK